MIVLALNELILSKRVPIQAHLSFVLSAVKAALSARDCIMDCVDCEVGRVGRESRQRRRSTLRNRNSHKLDKHACLAEELAA